MNVAARALGISLLLAGCSDSEVTAPAGDLPELEARMSALQSRYGIPGMSAAIASRGNIVWSKGFGVADKQTNAAATPETLYHLASLTKTFASTVIQQLIDEGKVGLDDPVSNYGITVGNASVRVKHLLTMTSEGTPGARFSYNGDRFGLLDAVISAGGKPFAAALSDRILVPAGLQRTAANPLHAAAFAAAGMDPSLVTARLARGYTVDSRGTATPVPYPDYFGTAAGMISSVLDIAAYSIALDGPTLLSPSGRQRAFTPTTASGGETLPYAQGWFSQQYYGATVIWHYGQWIGNSSLLIRIPSRELTLVILANSDDLSSHFALGAGQLLSSPFADEFLRAVLDSENGFQDL